MEETQAAQPRCATTAEEMQAAIMELAAKVEELRAMVEALNSLVVSQNAQNAAEQLPPIANDSGQGGAKTFSAPCPLTVSALFRAGRT